MAETSPVAPRRVYAFLQSKNTSQGFARMRTRGAAPPPFQAIQVVTQIAERMFLETVAELESSVVMTAAGVGYNIAGVSDEDPLTRHLLEALRERIKKAVADRSVSQKTLDALGRQFLAAQQQYFEELAEDGDEETQARVLMALDSNDVFRDRLEGLRAGYLESSLKRIAEGQSDIRKRFIAMFSDWVEGRLPDLTGFEDIMTKARQEAGTFSRFFARDQFSRFNRALTLVTYKESGAKWVQWLTVGDGRVRKSHRLLKGKIFRIDDLPEEYLDYMCRCAMIPIYDLKGRKVSKGDGVRLAV